MCDKIVESKEELQIHHQNIHNIISCKECRKGFATKQSHTCIHAHHEKQLQVHLVQEILCIPSELDAHMVKHETLPNFSCNIVGCSRV